MPVKPDIKKAQTKKDNESGTAGGDKVRGGSRKDRRSQKKTILQSHETKVIKSKGLPPRSKLLDEQEYTVQDIEIKNKNTRYRIECWLLPDGSVVRGDLPIDV